MARVATPAPTRLEVCEPTTRDHGEAYWTDRTYQAVDSEGHHGWFGQRIRTGG